MSGFARRPAWLPQMSLGLLGALLCWMMAPVWPGPTVAGASATPPTTSMANDSLRLILELPDSVEAGRDVPMTLLATNPTDRPLDLYLTSEPPAFDLTVTDSAGEVVWRRLEGEILTMVLRLETLEPGGTLSLSDVWDQRDAEGAPVPPGTFTVRGELLTEQGPVPTKPQTLTILPGGSPR